MRWLSARGPSGPDGAERCGRGAAGGTQEAERVVPVTHQTLLYQPLLNRSARPLETPHDVGGRARRLAALGHEGPQTALKTHVGVGQSAPGRVAGAAAQAADWMSGALDPDGDC